MKKKYGRFNSIYKNVKWFKEMSYNMHEKQRKKNVQYLFIKLEVREDSELK